MTSEEKSATDSTESKQCASKCRDQRDLNLASTASFHFGQLVWGKLGAAPFWPAVVFTEENQDWIRQKGEAFPGPNCQMLKVSSL